MLYCDSKKPARKTKASYKQSLRIFSTYLRNHHNITEPAAIKTAHIRSYIQYLRDRGKYTVVAERYKQKKAAERSAANKMNYVEFRRCGGCVPQDNVYPLRR
ncbi:hypothetical protein M3221_08165 [Domibacillus indicus]|nr:hypothetical protein [Domibacillus indicus]MCM3788375.1 hypothetical protein [Domibacillus indicus]